MTCRRGQRKIEENKEKSSGESTEFEIDAGIFACGKCHFVF